MYSEISFDGPLHNYTGNMGIYSTYFLSLLLVTPVDKTSPGLRSYIFNQNFENDLNMFRYLTNSNVNIKKPLHRINTLLTITYNNVTYI